MIMLERMPRCLALVASLFLSAFAFVARAQTVTPAQQAADGIRRLQSWYSPATGVWAAPSGWWNWANSLTVLAEYERVTGDRSYTAAIADTFRAAPVTQHHPNFENKYYDDMGWWALGWIEAYDVTGNASYLTQAETIFTTMTGGWDNTCGGGVWWTTDRKYKNAIPNELFLEIAAKLVNRTSGATSAGYLAWARKEWSWFRASGMINSAGLINDGLDSRNPGACVNNKGTVWTYNQGVVLGGLVELHRATGEAALLHDAQAIADAALSSGLVDANGVLTEPRVGGTDAPQFKGIFMRNLLALYAAAPNAKYKAFILHNAASILAHDQSGDHAFGAPWQGPVDTTDSTRQTSALDCLIAAVGVQATATAAAPSQP